MKWWTMKCQTWIMSICVSSKGYRDWKEFGFRFHLDFLKIFWKSLQFFGSFLQFFGSFLKFFEVFWSFLEVFWRFLKVFWSFLKFFEVFWRFFEAFLRFFLGLNGLVHLQNAWCKRGTVTMAFSRFFLGVCPMTFCNARRKISCIWIFKMIKNW